MPEEEKKGEEKKAVKPEKKAAEPKAEEKPKEEEKARFRKGKRGDKEEGEGEKRKQVVIKKKVELERYIVRLVNTDIPGDRTVMQGVQGVRGVGPRIAQFLVRQAKVDPRLYIGNLPQADFERLEQALAGLTETAPEFMLNRRNDWETGEDMHLLGQDVDIKLVDDINLMKKIRSYKGVRHETGQKVRGQRTRSNGRTGLTLGVIRAKAIAAAQGEGGAEKKEEKKEEKKAPAAAAEKKK